MLSFDTQYAVPSEFQRKVGNESVVMGTECLNKPSTESIKQHGAQKQTKINCPILHEICSQMLHFNTIGKKYIKLLIKKKLCPGLC